MAELIFRVKAEYDSAIQCRKELDELVKKMKQLDENSSPQEIERYVKRYAELTAAYEKSISFVGKAGAMMTETWKGVVREIKYNVDATENLGTKQQSLIDAAQKRLQLENNIFDTIKKQRDVAESQRKAEESKNNANKEGLERNKSKLSRLESALSAKYTGQNESVYSESDKALLEKGRESVRNWEVALASSTEALEKCSAQVMVYDQLMEDSKSRTEQLTGAVDAAKNVYTGFAKTVESTAPKVFISEEVFRRYDELKTTIEDLQKKLEDAAKDPDVDLSYVKDLQDQLSTAQEEFRTLESAARNTASVLGSELAGKVEKALEKMYAANDLVRKTTNQVSMFEEQLESAKRKLAEAKDPVAVTQAREEIDKLQESLDNANDRLAKFKAERKDALEEVQRMSKEVNGGGEGPNGPDITSAVTEQVKGLMGNIAAIAGIGFGLNELKDFFSQARQWREYFQDIESSMKVFLGSAEKGAEFTAKLKDHAYYNMFEFSDLAAASQQMISYGHNVESIISRLDQLSNVATGTHGSLMELVDTYNRAKATGVVDARGIQSWAVKGVMIKDVLRDMGEVTAGTTITFEQLNKVLDKITGEGGQFHNLMLEMMDNISAESGQLEDNLAAMYEEVGAKFEGVFVKWLKLQSAIAAGRDGIVSDSLLDWGAEKANDVLDDLLKNWERYIGYVKDIVVAYGTYRAALIVNNALEKASAAWKKFNADAIAYKKLMTKKETAAKMAETVAEGVNTGATNLNTGAKVANAKATDMLSLAMVRLRTAMMSNPYMLVVAGLAAVAYAVYSYYDGIMTTEKAQRMLNKASEDFSDSMKEQEQIDRDHIGTIKNKNASLLAQTKAYKELIAARSVFAKFSKDDIANMSQEQVNTLLTQDTEDQNEKRIRAQAEAAKELQSMFKGKGMAFMYAEDEDIDEVINKFGLLPEYAQQLKDSIDGMTDLSDWADKLAAATGDELRNHLSENAEMGIVEGFKKGFGNPAIQAESQNAISAFSAQMMSSTEGLESEILNVKAQIAKLNDTKMDSNARARAVEGLNGKLKTLTSRLATVRREVSDTFMARMQPQLEQAQKTVDELNQQLINATGTKRAEIEAKLNDANNDLTTVKSIMSYFEAGVTNKELVISVREQMEDAALGDEKLVEIGNAYKNAENEAVKYLNKVDEVRAKMQELGVVTEQQAQSIASDYELTTDAISNVFDNMYSSISKNIEDLDAELRKTTDPNRQNDINLEIKEKQKILDYIDNLKSNLLAIASNPYELRLNVIGKAEGWLKDLLKKAGYKLDEGSSEGGQNKGWGDNDFTQRGLNMLGIGSQTDKFRKNSEKAQEKATQAQERIDDANKQGPDKKTGKQWKSEKAKALRADINKLTSELSKPLEQKDAEEKQSQLDQKKSELKRLEAEGKKGSARRSKEIAEELKYQEQLANAQQEAERARTDAMIALKESDYLREKAQREEQHRRTLEDLDDQEEEIYKKIYQQRKADYENKHSEQGLKYENTANGKAGWSVAAMAGTLNKKEQALYDAENAKRLANIDKENAEYARGVRERYIQEMSAMADFLNKWGDYEQQKYAITMEYEEKIRKASSPLERANMALERDEKQEKLDSERLNEQIDWAGIFSDLRGHTKEYLIGLRDQLQELLKSGKITDVTQMATIQEKVQAINEEISKQGGLFSFIGDRQREHNRLVEEAAAAEERRKAALAEQTGTEASRNIAEFGVREQFEKMGIDKDTDIELGEGGTLDSIRETYGEQSKEYKILKPLLDQMAIAEGKLGEARKKTAKATKEAENAEDAQKRKPAQAIADWFADAQQFISEKGIDQIPDLLNTVGLGDAGEVAGKGLSAFNNAAGAAADFASDNYIGAAMKGISAVTDVVGMFGGGSNQEEMLDIQRRAQDQLDIIADQVTHISKRLEESYGATAIEESEKMMNLLESSLQQIFTGLKAAGENDYGTKHSEWYRRNYDTREGEGGYVDRLKKKFGLDFNGYAWQQFYEKLLSLGAEESSRILAEIRDSADTQDIWSNMMTSLGYDNGALAGWIKQWVELGEQVENAQKLFFERLTATTADNVFDDFMNNLYDLANGSRDVFENIADNWQEMVNRMVLNNMFGQRIKDFVEGENGWYKRLASLQSQYKDNMNSTAYKKALDTLKQEYENEVKAVQTDIDALRNTGIIQTTDAYSKQDAAHAGVTSITYEQADSLIGIEMAKQIILEQMLSIMRGDGQYNTLYNTGNTETTSGMDTAIEVSLLTARAENILAATTQTRDIVADSRDILAGMAIHVEEIRDGVVDTIVPRIKNIDDNLNRVYKIVENQ